MVFTLVFPRCSVTLADSSDYYVMYEYFCIDCGSDSCAVEPGPKKIRRGIVNALGKPHSDRVLSLFFPVE